MCVRGPNAALSNELRMSRRADAEVLIHARGGQPELYSADGGLGAVGYPELGEDASYVRLDGAYAEEKVPGDLGVRQALAE